MFEVMPVAQVQRAGRSATPVDAAEVAILLGRVAAGLGWRRQLIVGRRVTDLDLAWLHRLWNDATQLDRQQPILAACPANFDEISKLEPPLECPGRYTPMEILTFFIFIGMLTGHRKLVLLCDDINLIGSEAGDRERDAIAILAFADDVEGGGVRIRVDTCASLEQIEQPIEADSRTAEGREIKAVPHNQILH